jgi:WD40 repeat protein
LKGTADEAPVRRYQLKGRVVTAIAFAPGDRSLHVATMPRAGFKALLDAVRSDMEGDIEELMNSPGKKKAMQSVRYRMDLFDLHSEQLEPGAETPGATFRIAMSPDDKVLVTSGLEGLLQLHYQDTRQVRVLEGHKKDITSLDFSADGGILLTAAYDKSVRKWNTRTGEQTEVVQSAETVKAALFVPGSSSVLVGDGKGIRGLAAKAPVADLKVPPRPVGRAIALSHDGSLAAFHAEDGIVLWNLRQGREQARISRARVLAATFAPAGHHFLVYDADFVLSAWSPQSGAALWRVKIEGLSDVDSSTPVAASADEIAIGHSRLLQLRSLADGSVRREYRHESSYVKSLAVDPGSSWAIGYGHGEVLVWSREAAQPQTLARLAVPVEAVAFSPDGGVVAALAGRGVTIWERGSGKRLRQHLNAAPNWANSLFFTPGGGSLVASGASLMAGVGGDHSWTAKVIDVDTAMELRAFGGSAQAAKEKPPAPNDQRRSAIIEMFDLGARVEKPNEPSPKNPTAVVLSADGRYVLSSEADGRIVLHSTAAASTGMTARGEAGSITGLAFAARGKLLASSNDENTVTLWDPASGKRLLTLASFPDKTWAVFAPDGRYDTNADGNTANMHWVRANDMNPLPLQTYAERFHVRGLLSEVLKDAGK